MKKSLFISIIIFGYFFLSPPNLFAQDTTQTKKELKASLSLQKAKIDLEKSKLKLSNLRSEYDKKRKKFEKQNSKGNLSPNAVASHAKTLDKLSKKISKELSNIEKLESYILKNETSL